MIDPTTILILIAILLGGFALVIVLIIYVIKNITRQRSGEYYAKFNTRIFAVLIDISILRMLSEFVWQVIDPTYYSFILQSIYMSVFSLFSAAIYTFFALALGVLSYLVIYVPLFSIMVPPWPSLLAVLFGFFYFFVFEAFFKGKTLGRLLMRIETQSEDQGRKITIKEAYYNALGKTFLLVDLILGGLLSYKRGLNPTHKERYTQRLARVVTVDLTYQLAQGETTEHISKPGDTEEKDWWR